MATATTVAGIAVAGCGEEQEAAPAIERFTAGDIDVGDEQQRVQLTLSNVEPDEAVDVYINVTSLTESNVDVEDLSVIADATSSGWELTDADLTTDERVIVRVTATVRSDAERVEETGTIEIDLTGLDTSTAEHSIDLEHHTTLGLSEQGDIPSFDNGRTATYDIIDPAELENVLHVMPGDIRAGDTEQTISGRILHATSEFVLGIDITPLTEVGIGIDDVEIVVEAPQDADAFAITTARVAERVVRLHFEVETENAGFDCRMTGLDTTNSEPTDGITYPIFTGERPPDPQQSDPFEVSGVTA